MAFLCPSRLGRNKHKRGFESLLEKLTESESVDAIALEDLVKLSWTTPDARRIILQNFTSYAPQEISVKQGQKVNYIYREGDWAYVVTDDKKEGFVPFAFLAKIGAPPKPSPRKIDTNTYTKKTSDMNQRKISIESEGTEHSDTAESSFASECWSNDSFNETVSPGNGKDRSAVNYLQTEPLNSLPMFYEVFLDERTNILHKNPLPAPNTFNEKGNVHPVDEIGPPSPSLMFKVMHNFAGQELHDLPVKAGETVHLLDDSDPGWFWVCKTDGTEGYVPSNYISEIADYSMDETAITSEENFIMTTSNHEHTKIGNGFNEETLGKSCQNELPTKWKVTNDLTGKNPACTNKDNSVENKKQRPKKPPRKKKVQQDGMSHRLGESFDSLDTCITDTSTEYLDYDNKSSCDELSPRSNVFNESSVFDSSFSDIYNGRSGQFGNIFYQESPRSSDTTSVLTCTENKHVQKEYEPNFIREISGQKDAKNQRSVSEVRSVKTSKHNSDLRRTERETRHRTEHEDHDHVQRREKDMTGSYSRQINDSLDSSISSHCRRYKRPLSMPAFKSYHEYKKDYFDEYFYEDKDIKFANRSKNDVVNVSEILKLRNRNEQRRHSHKCENFSAERRHERDRRSEVRKAPSAKRDRNEPETYGGKNMNEIENQGIYHKPKLKQILLDLPSTKIEHKTEDTCFQNGNATNKQNQSKLISSRNSSRDSQNTGSSNNNTTSKRNEIMKYQGYHQIFHQADKDVKPMNTMVRQFNSSTDLRETEVKKQGEWGDKPEINKLSDGLSNKNNLDKNKKAHLRLYNSSTDLREIRGKPDWSFGYPRKTRKSIGRAEADNRNNSKSNEKKGGLPDNCNSKAQDTHETKSNGGQRKAYNHEERPNNKLSMHHTVQNCETNKAAYANKHEQKKICGAESKENDTSYDEAMMVLLSQTGNLLQKTDKLLDDGGNNERDYETEELNGVAMKDRKIMSSEKKKVQLDDRKNFSKISSTSNQITNANEKCNKFLTNNTIGIHGMTHFVAQEDAKNTDNEPKDARKEKSNVMKENSSEIVSDELKSLDLQDIRGITEFVCQCDYEPDTDNMLPLKHGEIVHVGLDGQDSGEWYWAFSPRLRKNGFVPKKYVKIPMVTII